MTADEVIPFVGPRELAGIAARLPALFLLSPKAATRFWDFSPPTFAPETRARAQPGADQTPGLPQRAPRVDY
jgi:hypothetical protein